MDSCFLEELPQRLVGDKAYDSDLLDARLAEERNVELIAPHRGSRRKPPRQDGRRFAVIADVEARTAICLALELPPVGGPL